MEPSEAVALIQKRADAWVNEDLATYLALTAEDCVVEVNGKADMPDRSALEEAVRRNYERFRPIAWDFHEIVADGSKVFAEWTTTLEARDTGVRWSYKAMSVCEVRDGVLCWWHEYRAPVTQVA
jgi:ketosteroid isomerase-like protein